MDFSRLNQGRVVVGALASIVLIVAILFFPWYELTSNPQRVEGGADFNAEAFVCGTGEFECTGFETFPIMRWLLLLAAIAPLILAWIIANDHALSWPRGQLTSVVAIAAFGLVGYSGLIDRPGDSNSLIGLKYGWIVSLIGTILMLVGSVMRQNETEIQRKPPGTI